ncbi:MAG: hypothetical protein KDA20_02585 [Phycisphaerales bacterium]|nr:hypothetical protein [Phycisphaerales bacterium]
MAHEHNDAGEYEVQRLDATYDPRLQSAARLSEVFAIADEQLQQNDLAGLCGTILSATMGVEGPSVGRLVGWVRDRLPEANEGASRVIMTNVAMLGVEPSAKSTDCLQLAEAFAKKGEQAISMHALFDVCFGIIQLVPPSEARRLLGELEQHTGRTGVIQDASATIED